jgi:two-component system NtrC family sensor kinase
LLDPDGVQRTATGGKVTRPSFLDELLRPKVLAVDDVPANLTLLQAIVEPLDCQVVTAPDGVSALQAIEQHSFAVLLLDIQMPRMDGYEVARRVRLGQGNRDVPIIFVTASAGDDEAVIRGYDLGAVDYLFKPVDPTILASKVRVFLDLYVGKARIARAKDEIEQAYLDLKTTQVQLVQAAKMASLGTLVAGVAHELNNPLAFCISHVHTARSDVAHARAGVVAESESALACDHASKRLEQTSKGLVRIRDLVQKLRTFSRVDEGEIKRIDVADSVASVVMMLEHRFRDRVAVTTEFGGPLTLECHPGAFNQAVMNLVSNAIDAVEGEGTVHIACGADDTGNNYVVRVSDSGPGIAPDLLERVFEPFFTTKPVGQGTGLGLAITYSIAEAHGGTLSLENGKTGAVATLTIPLADDL